jgi:hypothetical protein
MPQGGIAVNAKNFRACLQAITAAGKIGERAALDLLQRVDDRAETLKASDDPMVAADPFGAAAAEIANETRAPAIADRLDAVRNATLRAHVLKEIADAGGVAPAPKTVIGEALGLEKATAAEMTLRGRLHGTNAGTRDNIESRWRGVASNLTAVMDNELRKAGLRDAALSGIMDRDIATALYKLSANEAIGDTPAEQVAKIVKPALEGMRQRLNGAGARIAAAVDFVAHTEHDPVRMRRAAGSARAPLDATFGKWWGDIEPELAQATFDRALTDGLGLQAQDAASRAQFGRQVFNALVSGVHMKFGGRDEGGFIPPAFEGTSNLARRLSEGRVLFFKDGAAWQRYNAKYGRHRTVMAAVLGSLDRGARQLAQMERFGTNPAANLNMIMRRVEELYRGDPDNLARFQAAIPKLKAVMAHLDGTANMVKSERWAHAAQALRVEEMVSDLGGVGVTHATSTLWTVPQEMVHHGYPGAAGRLYSLGQMMKFIVRGRGPEESREILADLGAYGYGLTRDMNLRFQADDMLPGKVAALAGYYMKYTGLHWWLDNTQAAARWMSAHYLGRHAGDAFEALDPHVQQMIAKYGIGAREWDQFRSVSDLPVADGMRFMTPSVATRIEGLDEHARGQLFDRLAAYYNDAAAHSTITPGVRERAAVLGTTAPGSPAGEFWRFFMQFKMWPVAAVTQGIGRDIWLNLSNRKMMWNLGAMMALATVGGYLRMTVNDLALGNDPRNPLDPKTLIAALAQGGGLGIYGDFLFGELNRMGGGLVSTLGGPLASDADSFIDMFNRFRGDALANTPHRHGRFSDLGPEAARFFVRHMPFANYVYLKGALDYLLWYHLYESASPGWWERANRRMAREQGRVMAGYTPGAGVPWAPWGVGASTMTVPARR